MLLNELYALAEQAFREMHWDEALRAYVGVVQTAPSFSRARYRIGDTLLNLEERKQACSVYRALSWHYIKAGQPLLGLVTCKMLQAIDPSADDVLEVLCDLYSSDSDRVAVIPMPEAPSISEGSVAPEPISAEPPHLYEIAARIAADTAEIAESPAQLPRIPLFSLLPYEAFAPVLKRLRLVRFADGERLIHEGQTGESFFMLADGRVRVEKTIDGDTKLLAQLKEGAVFGEMALMVRAPRTATVRAVGEVAALALSRGDLEDESTSSEAITAALRKFTRGRLLANLAATSPLFSALGRAPRRQLMRQFQSKIVHRGDIVIEEGEPGRGLYVILRGTCEVSKKEDGATAKLATLGGGDVFGEIALLRNSPTVATVTAQDTGELLFLSAEAFATGLEQHSGVLDTLRALSTERLRANRLSAHEDVPFTDDAVLLF